MTALLLALLLSADPSPATHPGPMPHGAMPNKPPAAVYDELIPGDNYGALSFLHLPDADTIFAGGGAVEILRLKADGSILWRGRLVVTDKQLVAALRDVIDGRCPEKK